jgi:hypothetical protein
MRRLVGAVLVLGLLLGCRRPPLPPADAANPTPVDQGVREMAERIRQDLAKEGPRAWLRHFHRSPAFFMASDGRLVFPSNDSADVFVADLATKIRAIDLTWGELRIDSLAPGLALMATPFKESLTDTGGRTDRVEGYFTGVAQRVDSGWKLRSAHWSLASGMGRH